MGGPHERLKKSIHCQLHTHEPITPANSHERLECWNGVDHVRAIRAPSPLFRCCVYRILAFEQLRYKNWLVRKR